MSLSLSLSLSRRSSTAADSPLDRQPNRSRDGDDRVRGDCRRDGRTADPEQPMHAIDQELHQPTSSRWV
jgi:hypothetical protein